MSSADELGIPAEVRSDPDSTEVLRAWVAGGGLVCSLSPNAWEDSAAWGIVLADVARHVANALHDLEGIDPEKTVARIREMFNAELAKPTDNPEGYFPD